jgi:hypothetical protein
MESDIGCCMLKIHFILQNMFRMTSKSEPELYQVRIYET